MHLLLTGRPSGWLFLPVLVPVLILIFFFFFFFLRLFLGAFPLARFIRRASGLRVAIPRRCRSALWVPTRSGGGYRLFRWYNRFTTADLSLFLWVRGRLCSGLSWGGRPLPAALDIHPLLLRSSSTGIDLLLCRYDRRRAREVLLISL